MAVNTSARRIKFLVGSKDYSSAVVEVSNWQSSPYSESGLVTTTATATLIPVRNLPGSLDDRDNPADWATGQKIEVFVSSSQGILTPHPAGALRLLSAEFNPEDGKLTLQLGCLLTLLNFRQPTDPDKAQIEPGKFTDRLTIVKRLFTEAGITAINCPFKLPFPVNYPIDISGSYLEAAGRMVYSAGYLAWVDRNEVVQIKPVILSGNPRFTMTIGGDQGTEIFYRRLSSGEGLRELIKVNGVAQVAEIPKYPNSYCKTSYGAASTVDPSYGDYTVATRMECVTEDWNPATGVMEIKTKISESLGTVEPEYEGTGSKTWLVPSESRYEKRQYELGKEGKLLKTNIRVFHRFMTMFGEYIKAREEEGTRTPYSSLLNFHEDIYITYSYDAKNRPTKVVTKKWETVGTILSGIGHDWSNTATLPNGMRVSELNVEEWERGRLNEWNHSVSNYKSIARLRPETFDEETTTNAKLGLGADSQASYREKSNTGTAATPPAPERRPPKASFSDKQVCGEVHFVQAGSNPYRERERSYSIEFLAGQVATGDELDYTENPARHTCTDEQCRRIAEIEGKLLYGRFKGQDIGTYLWDEFYQWEPLMRVNAVEPSGKQRAFVLDDAHWFLDTNKAICNFSAAWIGDASDVKREVAIAVVDEVPVGATAITVQPTTGFIPAGAVITIGNTTVTVVEAVQLNSTVLVIAPTSTKITSGSTTSYAETILIPPVRATTPVEALGYGRITARAFPYAITALSSQFSVKSTGTALETSVDWDAMTEEQWNNMSQASWNSIV